MKRLAVVFLLFLSATAHALDVREVSRRFDNLYRSEGTEAVASMTVVTPDFTRTLKMRMWSRGLDYTLIRVLEPPRERGMATLKRAGEMWNFLPKINKTMRVPPSMMSSSWMGSDLTNDDLVRHTSWERDYDLSEAPDPPRGQAGIVYIPKPDSAVTWSRVVGWFDPETLLPTSTDFYDEKGRKVRVMTFSEVGRLGGRTVPRTFTVTPLTGDKAGNRTTIRYEEARFDLKIPMEFFSQTNLREER